MRNIWARAASAVPCCLKARERGRESDRIEHVCDCKCKQARQLRPGALKKGLQRCHHSKARPLSLAVTLMQFAVCACCNFCEPCVAKKVQVKMQASHPQIHLPPQTSLVLSHHSTLTYMHAREITMISAFSLHCGTIYWVCRIKNCWALRYNLFSNNK